MEAVHDRMPVILDSADWDQWLSKEADKDALKELIRPFPFDRMSVAQVSTYVNNARNQGEGCQAPFTPED
jgi:putative SOS response-associated peptidase YedK